MSDTLVTSPFEPVKVERLSPSGEVVDTVELDGSVFGRAPNVPLMHQVVTAQLAARRSGTQSTKTRAEVAGGGAKPYRQKGTGRARQGTIRAPHYAGGGIALGPKPRSYAQHTPRKMTRLALYGALSDRAQEGRVRVVNEWEFEFPRTKDAIAALSALGVEGSVLVVLGPDDATAERSFANLPEVDLVTAEQLTAYDVLSNDWIVFTSSTVPGGVTPVAGSAPAKKAPAKKAPAKKAAASKEAASSTVPVASDDLSEDGEASDAAGGEIGVELDDEELDDEELDDEELDEDELDEEEGEE